ncbi:MAG: beta-phosphoglucomutase family hydrolase [Acidimicrobiales bacterium]|nr:beta-phosphoglucomutase family hydrolase [Acidimicrobiales bacterium]MCB1259946.1 beta-phosphoglucomutase family hydrolase [Acidimicrobiales bacterium]
MSSGTAIPAVDAARFDAVLFDLDGVITDTAKVHSAAWAEMFDAFLQARAQATGDVFVPFSDGDYLHYVDGKPRYDGVRDFLASRAIELPEGTPDSPPDERSVCGLGNAKNILVRQHLADTGVTVFDGTVRWIDQLTAAGVRIAVVSSSRDTTLVLAAAGLSDRFEAQVDGLVRAELGLAGKPAPDTYLEAARRLGVPAERAVVVEDAISGVQAGAAGRFGLVIGVDRTGIGAALHANGADLVVTDLAELLA